MGMGNFHQGYFKPRHPEKYIGNVNKIRFMSSWELKFDQFLDNNPNILRWSSEEIAIPYIKPTTGRVHKYYPDYWVEYNTKAGKMVQEIIEVKPSTQVKAPKRRGKSRKTQLYEDLTYAVNIAKWQACKAFCDSQGITFRIVTEQQLFK